jgi:hypothetical protein
MRWETGSERSIRVKTADDGCFCRVGATGRGGDHAHGQGGVDPDAVCRRDLQYFPARVPPGLLPGEGAGERGIPEPGGENRRWDCQQRGRG